MLGISVMTLPLALPSAVSKKFLVSEYSSSDPMLCAPPPPIATDHAFFVDGAEPPNTLPIDAVNMVCADAAPSSAMNAATIAVTILLIRTRPSEGERSILAEVSGRKVKEGQVVAPGATI